MTEDPATDVSSSAKMAWAIRQYRPDEVDAAGDALIDRAATDEELDHAYLVINNFRSSHSFPLNTFQIGLRARVPRIDRKGLVAQRLKRLSSIEIKLRRFDWLKLSQMQDIAGCRAVVSSVARVRELVDLYRTSEMRHAIDDEDDYIEKPKGTGYRGIHIIYRYLSDRSETYNGLKIEMQFRSVLQHAWATAVETVDTFEEQALKAGRGEQQWRRFFRLMSSAIARRERTPLAPNTPTDRKELVDQLREHTLALDVVRRLRAYAYGLQITETPSTKGAHSFLVNLDPTTKRVRIVGYTLREMQRATKELALAEREIKETSAPADTVLVSVESLKALRRAYPNYYLDTRLFIRTLQQVIYPSDSGDGQDSLSLED
jgi:hypothetical protein